jgi:hypothetical protein
MGHVFQLVFDLAPVGTSPNHLLEALVHILELLCCGARRHTHACCVDVVSSQKDLGHWENSWTYKIFPFFVDLAMPDGSEDNPTPCILCEHVHIFKD